MTDAVSVAELVRGLAQRGSPLAAETGLFMVLQATESLGTEPRDVAADKILVNAEGLVTIAEACRRCDESTSVRATLAVLEHVVDPPTAGVRALIETARASGTMTLSALRGELEAQLVPLNRGAANRVLGRLVREHHRARAASPSAAAAASDTSPEATPDASATDPQGVVLSSDHGTHESSATDTQPDGVGVAAPSAIDTQPEHNREPAAPPPIAVDTQIDGGVIRSVRSDNYDSYPPQASPKRRSGRSVVLVLLLIIAAGLSFAIYRLRQRPEDVPMPSTGARSGPAR